MKCGKIIEKQLKYERKCLNALSFYVIIIFA